MINLEKKEKIQKNLTISVHEVKGGLWLYIWCSYIIPYSPVTFLSVYTPKGLAGLNLTLSLSSRRG